jgi:glycosyltransferase involved in cell wall biosynthesis
MADCPEISIIIPTKGREEIFNETLVSVIKASIGLNAEIIIVNDSVKPLVLTKQFASDVFVLQGEGKGVAKARNAGFNVSRGKWVLFLDNDMIVNQSVLVSCLDFIRCQSDPCCINANWKYPPELIERIRKTSFGRYLITNGFHSYEGQAWLNVKFSNSGFFQIPSVASAFLMMERETFIKSGGYNEAFSFAGFEDHEFAQRLLNSGIKAYILSGPVIYHNEKDYVFLCPFLERKRRSAFTRRQGVAIVENGLELNIGFFKKLLYPALSGLSFFYFFAEWLIRDKRFFDPLYNRVVNRLLGIFIFRGYYKDYRNNIHEQ